MDNKKLNGKLVGLIPAVITPMDKNGDINPPQVEKIMRHLKQQDISAIFVCGSTGEGTSMSIPERKEILSAYQEYSDELPVIAQVGDECIRDAIQMAEYAAKIGVDGIAALPPRYFTPRNPEHLKKCIKNIADVNKRLPFYYYHIPGLSGVHINMYEFLKLCDGTIENLKGIKFSYNDFPDMLQCVQYKGGEYNIFHGLDQTLLNGLTMGVQATIGSGYNFAAPLYHDLIQAFQNNDLDKAREYQNRSIKMMDIIMNEYRGHPAFKAMMKIIGIDCGPTRLPLETLSSDEIKNLEKDLRKLGFFEWIE